MKLQRIDQKFQRFGQLFVLGTWGKDKAGRRLMLAWCTCGNLCNLKRRACHVQPRGVGAHHVEQLAQQLQERRAVSNMAESGIGTFVDPD
jgi:hypothetical protein